MHTNEHAHRTLPSGDWHVSDNMGAGRSLDDRTAHANKTAQLKEMKLAKAKEKKAARNLYTAADIKLLKQHSKARTPVSRISKEMKRTVGSLRQKAQKLGIGLGHQR
jgi:hypothetical protein